MERIDTFDILLILDGLKEKITSYSEAQKYKNLFNSNDIKIIDNFFRSRLKRLEKMKIMKSEVVNGRKIYYTNENNVQIGKIVILFFGEKKDAKINLENGLLIKTSNNSYYLFTLNK